MDFGRLFPSYTLIKLFNYLQILCENSGPWEEINTRQMCTWSYLWDLRCLAAIVTTASLILAKS